MHFRNFMKKRISKFKASLRKECLVIK